MMDQYSLIVQMVEWKIVDPGSNPTSSKLELQLFSVSRIIAYIMAYKCGMAIKALNWLGNGKGTLNKHFASCS